MTARKAKLIVRRDEEHVVLPGDFTCLQPKGELADPPEIDFLVTPLLARRTVTLLVGYGASLKTWLALEFARAVATGTPCMGRFDSRQGRAVYLDWETNEQHLYRRVSALLRAEQEGEWPSKLAICSRPDTFLTDEDVEERLKLLAQRASLIIVDTLRAATPGVDENDSGVRSYIDMLGRVASERNSAVLVLHHAKKRGGNNKTDRRELMRGSSALFDAADAVLFISRDAKRQCCRVQQIKGRDGEEPEFEVALHEAFEGSQVRAYDKGDAPTTADAIDARRTDEIVAFLRRHPRASQNAICEAVGGKAEATRSLIRQMGKDKLIANVGKGAKQAWIATEDAS